MRNPLIALLVALLVITVSAFQREAAARKLNEVVPVEKTLYVLPTGESVEKGMVWL